MTLSVALECGNWFGLVVEQDPEGVLTNFSGKSSLPWG